MNNIRCICSIITSSRNNEHFFFLLTFSIKYQIGTHCYKIIVFSYSILSIISLLKTGKGCLGVGGGVRDWVVDLLFVL